MDPGVGRIPLGDYAKRWIAERPGLSSRTLTLYERLLRLHIAPGLGGVDLVDLTPASIRQRRKDLLEGGLGEVTAAKCYRLLRSILNTAVDDDELIRRNPCRIKGAEREASPERSVATPAQIQALVGGHAASMARAGVAGHGDQLAMGRADG